MKYIKIQVIYLHGTTNLSHRQSFCVVEFPLFSQNTLFKSEGKCVKVYMKPQ